ncbi:MAG: hypothetical protein MJE68_25540 [Proteobacteria bacterium]|nr:hypothetical protein [Pseudomonadota bacterium]
MPQIPPYTIDIKDLYTVVMKNPYDNPVTLDNTEARALIPPHTAEELYTAVGMGNVTMDEEEPSPIPPYSMEDCY